MSSTSSTGYGSKPPKEASRPHLRKPRTRRWAAVALNPIAITKDSRSSDSGRLVGGATHTHRLEVKPVVAVKIASERSQKHRLGVGGGGLFSEKQPDGAAP